MKQILYHIINNKSNKYKSRISYKLIYFTFMLSLQLQAPSKDL